MATDLSHQGTELLGRTGDAPPAEDSPEPSFGLIQQLIQEQQNLSVVEEFSALHESDGLPAQAKYYKKLLPTTLTR